MRQGRPSAKITVEICRATGDKTPFVKLIFTDCIITKHTITGSGGSEGEMPTEDLEFNFGSVEFSYQATDHKSGALVGGMIPKKWTSSRTSGLIAGLSHSPGAGLHQGLAPAMKAEEHIRQVGWRRL